MFYIYPYMRGSGSVAVLKELLGARIIKLEGSRYRQRPGHTVINYGNSRIPSWLTGPILNRPEAVSQAKNKLHTFERLRGAGVATVQFTTSQEEARGWLSGGHKVFVRHNLTGHSGEGIEVVTPLTHAVLSEEQQDLVEYLEDVHNSLEGWPRIAQSIRQTIEEIEPEGMTTETTLPDAPLYTRAISNAGEYRVHVFNGQVILYQKKSRRVDEEGNVITPEGEEADVRNLSSNWVYRTGNLRRLERVELLAIDAVRALGLDFGAVDIIMDGEGAVYVLEVNTAPGLGNTSTQEAYRRAFNGESPLTDDVGIEEDEEELY